MKLQRVKVFRSEDEAILLTEHLTRSGVYGLYRPKEKYFEILVREVDVDIAINLIANCPMLKDLESYKLNKLGKVS